jgi:hypothetical protein
MQLLDDGRTLLVPNRTARTLDIIDIESVPAAEVPSQTSAANGQ